MREIMREEQSVIEINFPENPMRYTRCYECQYAEWDGDRKQYWCARLLEWCNPSEGCMSGSDDN